MNAKCPHCGSVYSITEAHIGRKFKCKSCGTALVVAETGIEFQSAPASPAPAAFGGGRGSNAPSRRAETALRDDEDNRDYEDDRDYERPDRRRGRGASRVVDFLAFRKMIIPLIIQIIFWFLTSVVFLGGLGFAAVSIFSGNTSAILMGLGGLLIGVPFYVLLIRMYCELVIVAFRINDTLTDIKNLLERQPR